MELYNFILCRLPRASVHSSFAKKVPQFSVCNHIDLGKATYRAFFKIRMSMAWPAQPTEKGRVLP